MEVSIAEVVYEFSSVRGWAATSFSRNVDLPSDRADFR